MDLENTAMQEQFCTGKFGTVGTLGSPLPLLSPSFLSLPSISLFYFLLPSPPSHTLPSHIWWQ